MTPKATPPLKRRGIGVIVSTTSSSHVYKAMGRDGGGRTTDAEDNKEMKMAIISNEITIMKVKCSCGDADNDVMYVSTFITVNN